MIKKIKEIYIREYFLPSFLSVFINPYYFLRKGLYLGIKKYSSYMKGILLDFGCGSKPYRQLFDVEKYIGLDILQSGHSHQNESVDVYYDGEKIPFNSSYFDCFFSSEVFEHVFNLEEILMEINRVLKRNAYLLITIPFVWDEHETPYDFGRYTSYGIRYVLDKMGFSVLKLEKSTNYIETLFQMWNAYLYQRVFPKNKYISFMLTFLIICPFNIMGTILGKILPRDYSFYHNNIILAKKVRDVF